MQIADLFRKLAHRFRRREFDQDLEDEIRLHLDLRAEKLRAQGVQPDTAQAEARRNFGNQSLVREDSRELWSWAWLDHLSQDLQYTLRGLRRSPTFAAMAVLTLALGFGANTAIFSLVDAVLLKPLPVPQPERLVMLLERPPNGGRNAVSAHNFLDWRADSKTMSLAGVSGAWWTLTGFGEPQRVQARLVSANYFDILGLKPASGRTFLPEEGEPGKDRVLLVSDRYWKSRLGGDPSIIGKTLMLDGSPYTVIGTLPPESWFDRHWADVWAPLSLTYANSTREFHSMAVVGRLRDGVTLASARAEMDGIGARIARDYPATNQNWGVNVDPLIEITVAPRLRDSLRVLFASVAAVLLICCVNLANLLLARSAVRQREVWVRMALGAGRNRLIRQFLTESVAISLIGGVAGLALGYGILQGLLHWMPDGMLPVEADVRMDSRVMAYLFAIAVGAGLLFGIAPALAARKGDPAAGLQEGSRGSTGGAARQRLRSALIVAEVALAFAVVATAGVLMQSFWRLLNVDPGFDSTHVVTLQLPRAMQKDTDGPRLSAYVRKLTDDIAALPGIRDVALTSSMPMRGVSFGMPFEILGRAAEDKSAKGGCGFKIVGPTYFQTLRIRLLKGRHLSETDHAQSQTVTVINETMAKRFFSGSDPIGQRLSIQRIITGKHALGEWIPWEIVGVVADEKTGSLDSQRPVAYVPFAQSPIVGFGFVVRGENDPRPMIKSIQRAIWAVNPDQAITDIETLDEIRTSSTAATRFRTVLIGGFAAVALVLAAVGIYGVVAYSVAQRTRELGIRAALGASRGDLLRLALRHSIILTILGLAGGALAAVWTGRLISTLLFNTDPNEAITLVSVGAILALVALAASYVPARRAARIDPLAALRHE